jgi:hypothetical protein
VAAKAAPLDGARSSDRAELMAETDPNLITTKGIPVVLNPPVVG